MAKFFWTTGSSILAFLGIIHLILTFFTNKFQTKDPALAKAMKLTSPVLSDNFTMWSGWQGFNASHSAGLIFIGLINIYLMTKYPEMMKADFSLYILNIITIGFYIVLAWRYWFNIPLFGLSISILCFIISFALAILKK